MNRRQMLKSIGVATVGGLMTETVAIASAPIARGVDELIISSLKLGKLNDGVLGLCPDERMSPKELEQARKVLSQRDSCVQFNTFKWAFLEEKGSYWLYCFGSSKQRKSQFFRNYFNQNLSSNQLCDLIIYSAGVPDYIPNVVIAGSTMIFSCSDESDKSETSFVNCFRLEVIKPNKQFTFNND